MQRSYLDYAMSVIVARALPDVRDGLKPVHRRILYAMQRGRLRLEPAVPQVGAHRRRRDGQVPPARRLGDLRRHGAHGAGLLDAPAADRRAGQFRLDGRRPAGGDALHRGAAGQVGRGAARRHRQGHGRFPAELRRYRTREPVVLPAQFPNLLVNGAGGIAVGMATNIPTHNLGEVIDACFAYLDDPEITTRRADGDRPRAGLPDRRHHHRARRHPAGLCHRPRQHRDARPHRDRGDGASDREAIIVTEVPYQVNKARMVERIAEVVNAQADRGHHRPARRVATATACAS